MSMSASIHRATKAEADQNNGTTWLHVENEDGDYITIFMPYAVALQMAEAFNAQFREDAA